MSSRRFLVSCALAGILLCMAAPAHAFDGRKITIAVNSNWPPMEMKDKNGRVTGYEIDLINAIAAEAGLQVKYVDVPWRRIFNELDEGKYDAVVASVSITDGRREKYDFSEPYFTAEQYLVVPKAKAEESMNGKAIAAFKLTTGAETIRLYQKCNITFYTVEETERAFRDLSKGYIDGILCDSPLAVNYAVMDRKYKGKFAIKTGVIPEGCPTPREDYGIVVKKGNAELLTLMNQGLKAVREKGIEDRLWEKWIKHGDRPAKMTAAKDTSARPTEGTAVKVQASTTGQSTDVTCPSPETGTGAAVTAPSPQSGNP